MKLRSLFESRCFQCEKSLEPEDVQPLGRQLLCKSCNLRRKKEQKRQDAEEQNRSEREENSEVNLFFTSQQMPDRGHDQSAALS